MILIITNKNLVSQLSSIFGLENIKSVEINTKQNYILFKEAYKINVDDLNVSLDIKEYCSILIIKFAFDNTVYEYTETFVFNEVYEILNKI